MDRWRALALVILLVSFTSCSDADGPSDVGALKVEPAEVGGWVATDLPDSAVETTAIAATDAYLVFIDEAGAREPLWLLHGGTEVGAAVGEPEALAGSGLTAQANPIGVKASQTLYFQLPADPGDEQLLLCRGLVAELDLGKLYCGSV